MERMGYEIMDDDNCIGSGTVDVSICIWMEGKRSLPVIHIEM